MGLHFTFIHIVAGIHLTEVSGKWTNRAALSLECKVVDSKHVSSRCYALLVSFGKVQNWDAIRPTTNTFCSKKIGILGSRSFKKLVEGVHILLKAAKD